MVIPSASISACRSVEAAPRSFHRLRSFSCRARSSHWSAGGSPASSPFLCRPLFYCLIRHLAYDSSLNRMPNEADTCRRFVVPNLQAAGWDNEPHSIAGQCYFTDGPTIVRGHRAERKARHLSHHGTVSEIADVFDGNDQLRNAVTELQTLPYAK